MDELFKRQAEGLSKDPIIGEGHLREVNTALGRVERFWGEQIRYIY